MFDGCICAIRIAPFYGRPGNYPLCQYEAGKWALLVVSNATFYPLFFLCITFEDERVSIRSTVL